MKTTRSIKDLSNEQKKTMARHRKREGGGGSKKYVAEAGLRLESGWVEGVGRVRIKRRGAFMGE